MNQSQFKDLLSSMPALPHSVPGEPFDIERSEAFQWIMAQPGTKSWIWNRFRSTGRIEWCSEIKAWRGIQRKTHAQTKPDDPDPSQAIIEVD